MPQTGETAFTSMEDVGVADFFDAQVELGRSPAEFARVWIHTHPGRSPTPSGVDEQTFDRCFGRADWAVMFILAENERCYGRLRFGHEPGFSLDLGADVTFEHPFEATDHKSWQAELDANLTVLEPQTVCGPDLVDRDEFFDEQNFDWDWRWEDEEPFNAAERAGARGETY
ncbi:hypothetical protein [Stratiformator vulcanicus]|uniref:JAB domain-containing protein n=1 Tax=Stratiformator vulcanicus TaxID=2527980 RepID=A0A517QZ07_9PLAN|nr:hypothetical protein [Stratiformator vulcanicus]QDT36886.1 hypothetical protein Pan189_12500 [Stratiformator vulcanicus]